MTQQSPTLAERYGAPRRSRRPLVVALTAVVAAAFGVWVAWVVAFHSSPEVSSQLTAYAVSGEHAATASWTVVRSDPGVRASCRLQALAGDHSVVGELTVPVTSGPRTQTFRSTVRTERRAGSVQLLGCTTPDRSGLR